MITAGRVSGRQSRSRRSRRADNLPAEHPRARLYEFIDKGIDNIIEKDLYAGLITSIHHAGLPQHRYGTLPAVPRRQDKYTTKFLQRREPFNTDLIAKVATMKEYDGVNSSDFYLVQLPHDAGVRPAFAVFLLQLRSSEKASTSDSQSQQDKDYGRTFYSSTINATPVRFGQEDTELTLTPLDKNTLVVDPYPFDAAPLKVTVRGRKIVRRPFSNSGRVSRGLPQTAAGNV